MSADDTRHGCTAPIDADVLMDYWIGLLSDAEQEDLEEHLLSCGRCSDRLVEAKALADALRAVVRDGSLQVVVSDAVLQRAAARGLKVREYTLEPGGSVQCTVTADDDLLVSRLLVDVPPAARVDVVSCDTNGVELQRLSDIPVRPGPTSVTIQHSMPWAKASPTFSMLVRLVGMDDSGGERLLGEYTFHHTRSLPGPGSWTA